MWPFPFRRKGKKYTIFHHRPLNKEWSKQETGSHSQIHTTEGERKSKQPWNFPFFSSYLLWCQETRRRKEDWNRNRKVICTCGICQKIKEGNASFLRKTWETWDSYFWNAPHCWFLYQRRDKLKRKTRIDRTSTRQPTVGGGGGGGGGRFFCTARPASRNGEKEKERNGEKKRRGFETIAGGGGIVASSFGFVALS